ncbi:hypothetical protein [Carboxylicivirga caseinilyticus]|uniref:hypothetical protein n=1 Tax=Carboxylicivirga caseinilyticus TaxID=3417572 RepID=UPI003D32DEA1|nr:hypothetical protein [Marinilabiliaceae bacterium A049]
MLEHQMKVLTSVSGNPILFKKELAKSIQWLNTEEQTQLINWVKENFGDDHSETINEFVNSTYDYAS